MAKGLATFTDAVFLLLISGVAAAILFYAASNYGRSLENQTNALLLDYYARQAVRVISTATVSKPGCEPDYLLAYLKEKAYYGELDTDETLNMIGEILGDTMAPIHSNYDYAVSILLGSGDDSDVYTFVWYHDPKENFAAKSTHCKVSRGDYLSWLANIGSFSQVYSYSVPLRFKLHRAGTDVYVVGRLQIVIWPAGTAISTPC